MKTLLPTLFSLALLTTSCTTTPITLSDLRTEGLETPIGIDCTPNLSWIINSHQHNVIQTGYHIIVASTINKLNNNQGDLWDTGPIQSSQSVNIPYQGKTTSQTTYHWKVIVTTNKGKSQWSQPTSWTSGLQPQEWTAKWIGLNKSNHNDILTGKTKLAARYLRKEFNIEDKPIETATLYISGLGLYELYVNGEKIGRQTLAPTPTDYSKTIKYNTFDLKTTLSGNANAIGVILGNGRFFTMRTGDGIDIPQIRDFGLPRLIAQLEIKYTDGTTQTIPTDTSWTVTDNGPITANNEFDGEEYDARKEMPGWDMPGWETLDTSEQWQPAQEMPSPGGILQGQINRNITTMETILPISIKEHKPGTHILDMGQNMVGRISIIASGQSGQQITLRFAETLNPDGSLYLDNIRGALVTDRYTLRGDEYEEWQPAFTYHGFRYVEITNYPGTPTIENFAGNVIHDEMETTGEFETSDTTINQIYHNAYWGIRGNYRGMPTDCPQRDERMGWLGDRAIGSQGESYIFNNSNLYTKWLDDIQQAQRPDGSIPDVAPNYWSMYTDNITWPGAYIIIANMLHQQYNLTHPIIQHYPSMKKWIDYMRTNYLVDHIMTKDTYGDWCMPPERPELVHSQDPARKTDGALISTAFYYRILTLMQTFADIQNKTDDANAYHTEAQAVKQAFNNKYLNPDGYYHNNTVTANLLPLSFGITPQDKQQAIFKSIVDKTTGDFNSHVSTGLIGIQWLMRGLTTHGRPDIALRIATNRTYPSWGYMIQNNATTIWELWNGNTANPSMNSGNHVMLLGDLIVWFYENLAGIRNHPHSAGFKQIQMQPSFIPGLDHVKATYNSVHGRILSHWWRADKSIYWRITIPANTTAEITLPPAAKNTIQWLGKTESLIPIGDKDGHTTYQVGSGRYYLRLDDI